MTASASLLEPNPWAELDQLIVLASERRLTDQQAARLKEIVAGDEEAGLHYVAMMYLQAGLWQRFRDRSASDDAENRDLSQRLGIGEGMTGRLLQFSSDERAERSLVGTVPLSHAPLPSSLSTLPSPLSTYFTSGWPVAYLVATVIFGIGLIIGAIVHVSTPTQVVQPSSPLPSPLSPRPSVVARITGMVDCEWEGTGNRGQGSGAANQKSEIINQKSLLRLGDRLALKSGLLEITYDSGAKVLLQGPVTYEVESDTGGYLSLGRLTARLEEKSEVRGQRSVSANQKSEIRNQKSFSVRTPTAVVTDLGTEFGVEVTREGNTSSYVFRGSVEVELSHGDGAKKAAPVVLHENESVRTERTEDTGGWRITAVQEKRDPAQFTRWMPSPVKTIDLLDIVAGGNGTGKHRERGIDPILGLECPVFESGLRDSDREYHRAAHFPMIDGVFVPCGGEGAVVLDSAGHAFDAFPRTSGKADGPIWARAAKVRENDFSRDKRYWVYWTGANKHYTPEGRGLLAFHANAGITFDLDAIRKQFRGVRLTRLRACAGPADDRGQYPQAEHWAGLWVFVDGRLTVKRTDIHPNDGPFHVNVPIGPDDRFLTLAVTDGNRGVNDFAWFFVGDPVLDAIHDP